MSQETHSLLLATLTMVCWGISNGLMKRPSLMIGSARAIRVRQFVMIVCVGLIFFWGNGSFNEDVGWYAISFSLGIFGYIPFYFFCQALRIGSVGVVQAIGNSFPVVVAILAVQFLGLHLNLYQWAAIVIAISGVVLLSLGKQPKGANSHIGEAVAYSRQALVLSLLACFLWGLFFTGVQIPNSVIGYQAHTFCVQMGSFLGAEIHIRLSSIKKRNISRSTLYSGVLAGVLAIIGSLSFYKALSIGNAGIVTAIAGSSPVAASLFGACFLNERLRTLEIGGILLAVSGVVLLGLFAHY